MAPAGLGLSTSKAYLTSLYNWIFMRKTSNSLLMGVPQPAKPPDHFHGVFTVRLDTTKKVDKEEEKKIKGVLERLRHYGIDKINESNVEYALRAPSSQGDPEAAFKLLMLLEDTYEGIVKPYDPSIKLLGAVNRDAVTCYLDSLLFAMFMRLDSFEAMLYDNFDDAKRKRLAGLLRLWVNMLRTGRLITTDITTQIQRAIADCGWTDAGQLKQQDPSEAFTFITGQLELPMLTLKMDMFHTGKEDPQDDHKFVNERLLEVAIIDAPVEGREEITLEDCLEHYFNNRIEVKRHLENQRRNTLKAGQSIDGPTKMEKESATHIEVVEVPETPMGGTPVVGTPIAETPSQSRVTPVDKLRPTLGRKRADSIFSQRKIELTGIDPEQFKSEDPNATLDSKLRKMSTKTEVLMPAWQFFKLLPWYTDNMPTSDAQVAAHFSKKRPVLGICLKRYSYTNTGQARRLDTYVDIPLEIAVPDFVSDENMHENGPLVGNFRLMLQSVVCHRGVSLNSGHYICISRVRRSPALQRDSSPEQRRNSTASDDMEDRWVRFDDLHNPRVSYVDIHEVLRKETPYLLFYQVQPIGEDGHSIHDLPSYEEATSRSQSDATPLEKPYLNDAPPSEHVLSQVMSEPVNISRPSTGVADFVTGPDRTSLDTYTLGEQPRGRPTAVPEPEPGSPRRQSITIDTSGSSAGSIRTDNNSVPTTPADEKNSSLLSVANKFGSRRGSRVSKTNEQSRSRPSSREPTNRFALNMSKLTQMVSNKSEPGDAAAAPPANATVNHVTEQKAVEPTSAPPSTTASPAPASRPPVVPSANQSKESVTIPRQTPKLRKEKGNAKRKSQRHEDRDCVLM